MSPVRSLRRVESREEILELTGSDPFVRCEIRTPLEAPAWASGAAVAVLRHSNIRRLGVAVLGPAEDVEALSAGLADSGDLHRLGVGGVTVVRESFEALRRHLPLADKGGDWEWLCTTTQPAPIPQEDRLIPLSENDLPDIRALLAVANARTDARPFEYPHQVWVGVRDGSGRLVACGVREPNLVGVPVLAGITVDESVRGTGLGLAVTARLTRDAVREAGTCTLGLYSDNDVARRLYHGLGYGNGHAFRSRPLLG
ncbi:MAG: GNAT family N-acetyltransferase [Intrasporangium sp.]|uniref:GNAT family N-acetyltransferase n=1 Tax=Intrasporangium sp. TaxID=1925024 RepID=UPI003F81E734